MSVPEVYRNTLTSTVASFVRAASISAILVGGIALSGWFFHLELLRTVYSAFKPTDPNSAFILILIGMALYLTPQPTSTGARTIALVCVLAVLAISMVTVAEYASHRDLGIDRLFGVSAERISPIAVLNFLAVGLGLLLTWFDWTIPLAQTMGLLGSFIGVLATFGYAFVIPSMYAIGKYSAMSVETAVMSSIIGLAVVGLRPDRGLARILVSPNVGGLVARRLLPMGIGFPFLLGFLALIAQVAHLNGTQFGSVILLFVGILVFTGPILWTAGLLYRTDQRREIAERHLSTQYSVISILSGATPTEDVSTTVLETICSNLEWDAGIVWECKGGGQLNRKAAWKANTVASQDFREDEVAAQAARGTEVVWSPKSVAFPIVVRQETVRVIQCFSVTARQSDAETLKVMETISSQIALFIGRRNADREIRRLNGDLLERAGQLEAANKELESFSYSVSHDLRAPLRHISGFVELLRKRAADKLDAQGLRHLQVIAEACSKMGDLVDDLLAFSRMGRSEMMKGRVDLMGTVQQVINEESAATSGRDIQWTIEPLPEVEGDAPMIRVVLSNYISNAIKYTQKRNRAEIQIGSRQEPGGTVIYVKDNGAGFDMKYVDKLFGVFQRLHREDEFEGTGIGLATARRIISRHHGKTWADAALGQGATFYFSLPNNSD